MASRTVNQQTADLVAAAILRSEKSRHRVAAEVGIAETTLRRKLQGTTPWTIEDVARIAAVLRVPFSDLLPDVLTESAALAA